MNLSFCLITNGKRFELLRVVLAAIQSQQIPDYEIIVAGNLKSVPGITYVEAADAAELGRLGVMRNLAVAKAKHDNIVLLDDDIVLSQDWYQKLISYDKEYDILTSQVRTPDGSRYCDHVTIIPSGEHRLLDPDQDDPALYMTGGGGWVMKNYVARQVFWDSSRVLNQSEDVEFSRNCQSKGFKISHCHAMMVYHADSSYTSIGRSTLRRKHGRSQEWAKNMAGKAGILGILWLFLRLWKCDQRAEAADVLRIGLRNNLESGLLKRVWHQIVARYGGELPDVRWFPDGDPEYLATLENYRREGGYGFT